MRAVSGVPPLRPAGLLAYLGVVAFPGISPTLFAVPSVVRTNPGPTVLGLVLVGGLRHVCVVFVLDYNHLPFLNRQLLCDTPEGLEPGLLGLQVLLNLAFFEVWAVSTRLSTSSFPL